MDDLLARTARVIHRRKLLKPGERILVAVSGGLDSMVLLRMLTRLAPRFRWRLSVAHLNHRLRGRSSDADERLVRRVARNAGLPCVVGRARVREFALRHKVSIEMAARKIRHQFLARAARKRGARSITLAHHADDQIELFFLRLLRGSGGEGLAGMRFRSQSPADSKIAIVRPLLAASKAELQSYARLEKIQFREDATNACLDIQRNRIRHELLPLLRNRYQPSLERAITRSMDIITAENELVTALAQQWLRNLAKQTATLTPLAWPSFDALPLALQRRCVQLQLLELGIAPEFELVEQLRSAANCPVALGAPNGGQFIQRRLSGQLSLSRASHRSGGFNRNSKSVSLAGGKGVFEFAGMRINWRLDASEGVADLSPTPHQELFDADLVGRRILLRHWRPGDRFQPIGMPHACKLQDLFTNAKIPCDRRRRCVLAITPDKRVFWVEGLRISEQFKVREGTKRRLLWRWERA